MNQPEFAAKVLRETQAELAFVRKLYAKRIRIVLSFRPNEVPEGMSLLFARFYASLGQKSKVVARLADFRQQYLREVRQIWRLHHIRVAHRVGLGRRVLDYEAELSRLVFLIDLIREYERLNGQEVRYGGGASFHFSVDRARRVLAVAQAGSLMEFLLACDYDPIMLLDYHRKKAVLCVLRAAKIVRPKRR